MFMPCICICANCFYVKIHDDLYVPIFANLYIPFAANVSISIMLVYSNYALIFFSFFLLNLNSILKYLNEEGGEFNMIKQCVGRYFEIE